MPTWLVWFLLLLVAVVCYQLFSTKQPQERPFSQMMSAAKSGKVKEVQIRGQQYQWTDQSGTTYRSIGVVGETTDAFLRKHNVTTRYQATSNTPIWLTALLSWLPFLVLLGVGWVVLRNLQIRNNPLKTMSASPGQRVESQTTFADVAGIDEAKEELQEIVAFLKNPDMFTQLGGKIPKGVLLMGAPGTGKTLLAKAVAGEAEVPFFTIAASHFVEMFVGVGASRVRELFSQAKENAPCIVFIDELDAVGSRRGSGMTSGGHDEREQTLNQLLVEMDGFEPNEGVIVVAATNRPDSLDSALLRPGRFDRRVQVPLPALQGREEILGIHSRRIPLADDVQLDHVARGTAGFSGAELANLLNEAALFAARQQKTEVNQHDLEQARDKVLMGRERRSLGLTEEQKHQTAIHEAGHSLTGQLLPHIDPIHKITIIPRGQALGITATLPTQERVTHNQKQMLDQLVYLMGGRAAEEIVLGDISSGAANDLERATKIAHKMVCDWGMSEVVGPVQRSLQQEGNTVFSDATQSTIDQEVQRLLKQSYQQAKELLTQHRQQLDLITQRLLQQETLTGQELRTLLTVNGH
jgi:cell division protease FtsH